MQVDNEPEILKDYTQFSNSFRIIAKQNRIQKQDNLFVIDADFDVLYTITPSAQYQDALDLFYRQHGVMPQSYTKLLSAYTIFKERIHNHMVKLPLCKKYFSMLSVINFFSAYLSTLKKHRKIPVLPLCQKSEEKGCPPLFPHLPLKSEQNEIFQVNLSQAWNEIVKTKKQEIKKCMLSVCCGKPDEITQQKEQLRDALQLEIEKNVVALASVPLRQYLRENESDLKKVFQEIADDYVEQIEKVFQQITTTLCQAGTFSQFLRDSRLQDRCLDKLLPLIQTIFPDKKQELFSFPINRLRVVNEQKQEDVEQGKKIVGGCGMQLDKLKAEPSFAAEVIWQKNWTTLQELATQPESWSVIKGEHGKSSVFSLVYEDVPPWEGEHYEWMESYLFAPQEENRAMRQEWLEVATALKQGELKTVQQKISNHPNLLQMQDHAGRTLLHYSATLSDCSATTWLIRNGCKSRPDAHGYLPIHYASMEGQLKQMDLLFKRGKSPLHAASKQGATPLLVAIQHGRTDVVKALLKVGKVKEELTGGYNAYHCALHHGREEILDLLLAKKITGINEFCEDGGTPLMLACELDSLAIVQKLINHGADPTLAKKNGTTALEIALKRNCLPVFKFLLSKVAPSAHAMQTACREGSLKMVKLLWQSPSFQSFENSFKDTPLHIAIRYANLPVAKYLIEKSVLIFDKKNVANESPFDLVVKAGFWGLISLFFQKGEIPQEQGSIVLKPFMKMNYHPFLQTFVQSYSCTAQEWQELLGIALEAGNHDTATFVLIPQGARLNQVQGPNNWTALHYLAKSDGIHLFQQYVREAKISDQQLFQPDQQGKSLAYLAAENRSLRVFRFLLEKMRDNKQPLTQHFQGRHLLYAVIEAGDEEAYDLVCNLYPDQEFANTPMDPHGTLPLHIAAKVGASKMAKKLCRRGEDPDRVDQKGFSPLYYAIRSLASSLVSYLLKQKIRVRSDDYYAAACLPDTLFLSLLLEHTPDINKCATGTEFSPLALAIWHHHTKAFTQLVKNGASIHMEWSQRWMPLHFASAVGATEILEFIIRQTPCDENRFVRGNNPLHWACLNGHISCISLLLQAGYSFEKKNAKGETAQKMIQQKGLSNLSFLQWDEKQQKRVKEFIGALITGDEKKAKELIRILPPHEPLQMNLNQQIIWGTPLQLLLYSYGATKTFPASFMESFLTQNQMDPNLPDSQGNTLAHLLLQKDISPTKIPGMDLTRTNHRKQTPLHIAAWHAGPQQLQELIVALEKIDKLDINVQDEEGKSPLFYALKKESMENIQLLLEKGADPNLLDQYLLSPLLLACQKEDLNPAKILIEKGKANVNQVGTSAQLTPLFSAMQQGNDELSFYLLLHGAKSNRAAMGGILPVHLAAETGKLEILRFLQAKGESLWAKTAKGKQPIHLAALQGHTNILSFFYSLNPDNIETPFRVTSEKDKLKNPLNGASPLHLASVAGKRETVEWLLAHHANPEKKTVGGMSVLPMATKNPTLLRAFQDYRLTEKTEEIQQALVWAIQHDQVDSLRQLCEWGGLFINQELAPKTNMTPLHYASRMGAIQCTQFLLQRGSNPFLTDMMGQTSLEVSAANKSMEQFQLLLQHCLLDPQFDLDTGYSREETLLHVAAKTGNLKHVAYLIALGASLNINQVNGYTPLHLSIKEGKSEVVRLLLLVGANRTTFSLDQKTPFDLLNQDDSATTKVTEEFQALVKDAAASGETLLHVAIRWKADVAITLLINLLDTVHHPDQKRVTPLHVAVKTKQPGVIRKLLAKGAQIDAEDAFGHTPLWDACFQLRDEKVARFLVKAGANPKHRNSSGVSILEALQRSSLPNREKLIRAFSKQRDKHVPSEKEEVE